MKLVILLALIGCGQSLTCKSCLDSDFPARNTEPCDDDSVGSDECSGDDVCVEYKREFTFGQPGVPDPPPTDVTETTISCGPKDGSGSRDHCDVFKKVVEGDESNYPSARYIECEFTGRYCTEDFCTPGDPKDAGTTEEGKDGTVGGAEKDCKTEFCNGDMAHAPRSQLVLAAAATVLYRLL